MCWVLQKAGQLTAGIFTGAKSGSASWSALCMVISLCTCMVQSRRPGASFGQTAKLVPALQQLHALRSFCKSSACRLG